MTQRPNDQYLVTQDGFMMDAIKDYYKILGVKPDASDEKIRERWLELVKHHHPTWSREMLLMTE